MRHEIFSWDRRQEIFSWGAPSNKKIPCLTKKSHVSCLLYKSHEKISWDMRLSHETEDRRFSHRGPTPQENLLSHKKISCVMPFSYIPWENLVRHEIFSCLMRKSNVSCFLHKSQKKISWDKRLSHETGDLLLGGPSPQEILLSHKKISCLMPSL